MIVYIEDPRSTLTSNCLSYNPDEAIESSFDPKFMECQSLDEIKDVLTHMENNNLHIKNGRDIVFRSARMIDTIEYLEKEMETKVQTFDFRLLTRTCDLRKAVYYHLTGILLKDL